MTDEPPPPRSAQRPGDLTLDEYQHLARHTDVLPGAESADGDLVLPLLGLAGEVGALASEFKKRHRDTGGYRAFADEVKEELGDVLWYAAILAHRTGLTLSEVAQANLNKTSDIFVLGSTPTPHRLYDEDCPPHEQLPRRLSVDICEVTITRGGRDMSAVKMHLTGQGDLEIGDPIDDNSDAADDYRFHDAFHLAHMAVLGWSPVMRSILIPKRKRRDERTDRVEDGGRAVAIEEGLIAAVFSEARRHSYFVSNDRIPSELIKTCRRMTADLEVADRTAGDWQRAVHAGYHAFNYLVRHRRARLTLDLQARTLHAAPLPPT